MSGVFEEVMEGLGLTPRPQQLRLVELARAAQVDETKVKLVQAGTGTGKSYALLSVALEAARANAMPSVVVCPNNTLIDQYVLKDAPSVGGVAGGKFVHIKGRSRYVCASSVGAIKRGKAKYWYREVTAGGELEWAKLGLDETFGCPGSDICDPKADCKCGAYEANAARRRQIVAEAEGEIYKWGPGDEIKPPRPCVCPVLCGAMQAKTNAEDADVVVTNAHVLVWDYLVGQYTMGMAHLLPEYGALFVDECHELEGVGRGCLTEEITDKSPIMKAIPGLEKWVEDITEMMVESDLREMPLTRSVAVQAMAVDASKLAADLLNGEDLSKSQRKTLKTLQRFIEFVGEHPNFVSIVEMGIEKTSLKRVCVDAGAMFNTILCGQPTVLASGTIPVSDRRRLGLPKTAKITDVGHPFDYSKSHLIISKYSINEPMDLAKRVDSAIRAINQLGGGTLMLFTSWSDVEQIVPRIQLGLNRGIDIYVQSREDPATLAQDVEDFRRDGNAVLAGVRSLFTGLDIPGPALRQVILWKLPWQVPTIEVQAIGERYGRSVYKDQMLMTMTQAIGRLIRSVDDTGRVIIMDDRASHLRFGENGMTHHLLEWGPK